MLHNESEDCVLGSILISPAAWAEVGGYLQERDFFHEGNRLIFKAIKHLSQEGKPVDSVSVMNKLKDEQCLTRAGGGSYISSLLDVVQDVANVSHHATEVKTVSVGRDKVRIGKFLSNKSSTPREDLVKAFSSINDLLSTAIVQNTKSAGELSDGLLGEILNGDAAEVEGIKIGFSALDNVLWGLHGGELCLLGARPSIGKSAFSLQVAMNVAKRNHGVLFIAPEMSHDQMTRRMLSVESGVKYSKILKCRYLSKADKEALREAGRRLAPLPLNIDETSQQTANLVRSKALIMKASAPGLGLLIVDHLGLLACGDDSYESISKISFQLKSIAKDLNIPVWACSQLSRNIEYRDDRRPKLSDLRSSGTLEQDAGQVLFMWNPKKGDKSKVEIFLEKHRNGPLGSATYKFDSDTTKFTSGSW